MEISLPQGQYRKLSYVARQFLGLSNDAWKALDEETRKAHVKSANRALNAAEAFDERIAGEAEAA